MRKPSWMLVIMMTAAVCALLGDAFAGPNTNLPFIDTFEGYTNGTPLDTGTNGWYGSSGNIKVQTNTVCTGTNAALIPEDCALSNRFESIVPTNVWIQMDARPILYDGTNCPEVNTNAVWMFFLNSNGNFVVHNGPTTNASVSTNWVVASNNVTISTNAPTWMQINIFVDFSRTNWDLSVDGVLVTNNIGFVNASATNFTGFDVYSGAQTSYLDNISVSAMATNQHSLIVLPSTLSAVAFVGRTPPMQTVRVYNVWSDRMGFKVTNNQPWVLQTNGIVLQESTTNVALTYASTVTNWARGVISNANVMVVATNGIGGEWGTQTVAVTMSIMDLQVRNLTNTVVAGSTPPVRTVDVINAGAGSFGYTATITNTCNWLSFSGQSVTSGTVNASSTNPLALTFSNTAGWSAGASNAVITIASSEGGGATQVVLVTLSINSELRRSPLQLTNNVMQGGWTSNSFKVWTPNQGSVNYTVTNDQPWLKLSDAMNGILTWPVTNTILITYTNTADMTVGAYYDTITIGATGCVSMTIDVTLNVQAAPILNVSPVLITNTVMEGQSLADRTLLVWNGSTNDYDIGYQVTTNGGGGWLTVVVTNNHLNQLTTNNLTVKYTAGSFTSAGSGPSNYTGDIIVTATNSSGSSANGSPVTIPVTVQVNPKPRLALSLTSLSQTVLQGRDAASQWFEIWNSNGYYTLNYTITKNASWLVLTPTSGTNTGPHQSIQVQYSTANLPAGSTQALITVVGQAWDGVNYASAWNATQQITVALSVTPFATLSNDAQSVYYIPIRKGFTPADTVFSVWNGGSTPGAMYFTVTVSPAVSWLRVIPSSGTSMGNKIPISVKADTTGLKPGVYTNTVRIEATDAASGQPAYGSPSVFTMEFIICGFKGFNFQGSDSLASDLVVYREDSGEWAIRNLQSGYATNIIFGGAGYYPVPGDYFGDGITDLGIYRPFSGSWYAWQVGAASVQGIEMQRWAGTGYVGVPGDYDGDGLIDPGVYVEQSGLWSVLLSGNSYVNRGVLLGGPGYSALQAGDYDGDGKVDFGVYHRTSGLWRLLFSASGYAEVAGGFGGEEFEPVPADYNGDGFTDVAIYETCTGWWTLLLSSPDAPPWWRPLTCQFGGAAEQGVLVPVPGDYDGDGGADLALYYTSAGNWYIVKTNYVPITEPNGYHLGGFGYQPVLP